jgi:hypothetical protein
MKMAIVEPINRSDSRRAVGVRAADVPFPRGRRPVFSQVFPLPHGRGPVSRQIGLKRVAQRRIINS